MNSRTDSIWLFSEQNFEPRAETIGVEPLVQSRLGGSPQVQVKDALQPLGRRQRHEFAAIFESTALYDPVKQLRLQLRDDLLKV